jgi:Trk-type K+ transport system membrane component
MESPSYGRDSITHSVVNITFEVASGYACVGISTGVPNQAYSFSSACHMGSKVITCGAMLRGGHKEIPVVIDRTVLVPGEELARNQEQDWEIRMDRAEIRSH